MRSGPIVTLVLLIGGAVGAWYWLGHSSTGTEPAAGGGRRNGAGGPVPVTLATVGPDTIPVYRQGIGNVVPMLTATVRTQVDGRLVAVEFVEGQDVKKGDVLARVDPALYQAAYDQTVAKKAQDEATLANARIDLERYVKLARDNAGPKQQADQQAATVRQLEAQVQADVAAIDSAKATLGYTTIVASFDGRVGLRSVDPGNIVHASDSSGIATISQVRPITVVFTLPQRDLEAVSKAMAAGDVKVEALRSGGSDVLSSGTLSAVDNQIDVTTGTFKLKATFQNQDLKLWPGQYLSTRIVVETLKDALTVPTAAVRRGPKGTFLYVLGDGNKVSVRPVELALQDDTRAVVSKGITAGEKVVTVGFAQLSDGARVIVPGDAAEAAKDATGDGSQRKRRNGDGSSLSPSDGQKKKSDGKKRERADGAAGKSTAE